MADPVREGQDRPVRFLTWLYRKLGRSYPALFITVELQSAFVISAATVGLLSFYYDAPKADFLRLFAFTMALTAVAVWLNVVRIYPLLKPITAWIGGRRSTQETTSAWAAAVGLPLSLIRRDFPIPVAVVIIPASVAATMMLDASWHTVFPLFLGGLVAAGYGAILHYLAVEAGMRPVLIDINHELPPRLQRDCKALPLRVRLMTALPMINVITGFVVAALTANANGGTGIGPEVLVAVGVATAISLELTVLLSKSILRPIADLQRATEAVLAGDYEVSVPVTTGDELGELAASYNQMVAGLAERERIREAFGTYLDREVAKYILSEGYSEEGVEVEVSILFCDVRDFTGFAAGAGAKEVVAELNRLFEVIVPVITRHGGHVDKFEGDGLLAVFGAPESYGDHADRAVRAACEIAGRVNDGEGGTFKVGVGVNTGSVVAGAIGGGGRLNFSVIGDAVNVAARVEAATRKTGDSVLITAATATHLSSAIEAESRGPIELKGIEGALELFAPRAAEPAGALPGEEPLPASAAADGDGNGPAAGLGRPRSGGRSGGLAPL